MSVRVQMELSDEEDRIVEVYRIEHKKKDNAEAIKEIIKHYKPLQEYKDEHKGKSKMDWLKSL